MEKGKKMRNNDEFTDIRSQSQFCTELMLRLNNEVQKAGEGPWSGMETHVRKQGDIKRIRRELLELSKMLNPWR
jgi:hypothetical protein